MDRLAALFEQLALPEITGILRRTTLYGVGFGIVALVLASLLGHALIGLGVCIGLGFGLANIRLVTTSVAKISRSGRENTRRPLASHTLARLGVTTGIVLALIFLVAQVGEGALGGIAVFYLLFLSNVMRTLIGKGITA